ncbi:MAG: fused MFS/spermidine synthase, partial [Xanthomonadales bacterium]|nr:fused MFS/spermidine synthase [Xanthomonadales bacterium]
MNPKFEAGRWLPLILLLFFLSGALALVYQVVWSRMMMHVFGSTALAVGTVLAAFMSGMALGAWYFGKIADRSPNRLRLYAQLEIGIAVFALASHLLLNWMTVAYPALFAFFGSSSAVFAVVRFVLAFLLVMAPTVLMGATLPVLTRFLVSRRATVGVNLSSLYAINTFGAVSGVLLTGFLLIGRYGIHVPVYAAAAGNLLIGLLAATLARGMSSRPVSGQSLAPAESAGANASAAILSPGTWRLILFGLGLSGFTSFAYEIYWTRSLVFMLGNSTYALTTMLAAFLTGIGLGGWLIRYLFERVADRAALFGWIQVALGVFSALALPILFSFSDPQSLDRYFVETSGQLAPLLFAGFGVAFVVMLIPATLIGATFPLVGEIGVRDLRETGAAVGRIYSVNTLGNVAGALLPGFFLLGWLGIQKGILAMAVLNVTLGFLVLFLRLARASDNRSWRVALPIFVLLAAGLMVAWILIIPDLKGEFLEFLRRFEPEQAGTGYLQHLLSYPFAV